MQTPFRRIHFAKLARDGPIFVFFFVDFDLDYAICSYPEQIRSSFVFSAATSELAVVR